MRVLFFCLAVVLFASCSQSKPEISFGFLELVFYQGDNGPQERFSFFIIPQDEDGIENLDELYLYNDREQLRWFISNDEWITVRHDGVTWIGTRSIALQDDQSLPRGQYRAVLVNKSGERAERYFTYDVEAHYPFPSLEISGGRYTIDSAWPNNRFICYDNEGNYVTTIDLTELSGAISDIRFPSSVRTVALWAEDPERFSSAHTNVTSIR